MTDSTFLVRFTGGPHMLVERCYIRHVTSGREAYIQGGPDLFTFLQDCLIPGARLEAADGEE